MTPALRPVESPLSGAAALRVRRVAPAIAAMALVAALSWLALARMDGDMSAAPADAIGLLLAFAMWAVMMTAMMLPTVAPAATTFGALAARRRGAGVNRATALFVVGYVVPWIAFALPATLAQAGLGAARWLDPMARSTNTLLSAALLLAAGAYQFTPLKQACVTSCRSPLAFLMAHWRDGACGALQMGLRHGVSCVGCCWALMAVMFVVGAMSIVWMGLMTLIVLGEKLIPARWHVDRVLGVGLVAAGLLRLVGIGTGG